MRLAPLAGETIESARRGGAGCFDARAAKRYAALAMPEPINHPRDPLHGITLERILNQLVQRHGWGEMGRRIPIRCFQFNPTVKSSLTFLRKTPWAREKVEGWYIAELGAAGPANAR
jgi:uncharacterized protein (DUF2132 family)